MLQGRGGELAAHHPPRLGARDQAGVLQDAQVLHEPGQRHVVLLRELGHVGVAFGERLQDVAPRPVGKRPEQRVQLVVRILNHQVQYETSRRRLSSVGILGP